MNRIIKRLGALCLGLGVLLLPALGFGQSTPGSDQASRLPSDEAAATALDSASSKLSSKGIDTGSWETAVKAREDAKKEMRGNRRQAVKDASSDLDDVDISPDNFDGQLSDETKGAIQKNRSGLMESRKGVAKSRFDIKPGGKHKKERRVYQGFKRSERREGRKQGG
jgi:hypothetical protein